LVLLGVEKARRHRQTDTVHIFLETARLVLRRFTETDVDHLLALDSEPKVMHFVTGGKPTSRAEIETKALPGFLNPRGRLERYAWAAIEKSSGEFLGWFSLRPPDDADSDDAELGYRLRSSAWNMGYATEGAQAVIRKGFTELGLTRIFARTMAVNPASRRVMERAGLTLVRTFHQDWPDPIEGAEHGEVEYSLCKRDWERR
jgi:RimJ/RimL family protein N-acetyltransferase